MANVFVVALTSGGTHTFNAVDYVFPDNANLQTLLGTLSLSAASLFTLNSNGSEVFNTDDADFTFSSGITVRFTAGGKIDLPNNGSGRFLIENVPVNSSVTAAALNAVTGGGAADTQHTHTAGSYAATSGEALALGAPIAIENVAGSPRVFNADANGAGNRPNAIGINKAAVLAANQAISVLYSGEVSIPDAIWDVVPGVADVGARVYVSETAGKLTITAPAGSGSNVLKMGIVTRGGVGAVKISIQIGEGLINP